MKEPSLLLHDIFLVGGAACLWPCSFILFFLPEAKGGMENVEGWSDYGLSFIDNNSINIYLRLRASPSYPKLTLRESKTPSLTESVEKFASFI